MRIDVAWSELRDAVGHLDLLRHPSQTLVRLTVDENGCTISGSGVNEERLVSSTIDGDVTEAGVAVVPALQLREFVARVAHASRGTIHSDGERMKLDADGSDISLRTINTDAFPNREHTPGKAAKWDPAVVAGIARVIHAVSTDASRPILTGVQITSGWAAATDSDRLAAAVAPAPEGTDLVVPGDVMKAVTRAGRDGCKVTTSERQITFDMSGTKLTTSLILGDFPNWRPTIEGDRRHHLTLDRQSLLEALPVLAVLATKENLGSITITPLGDQLELLAQVPDIGEQRCHVTGTTSLDRVTFQHSFLADLAEACQTPAMELRSNGPVVPFTLHEHEFIGLVCPVRGI